MQLPQRASSEDLFGERPALDERRRGVGGQSRAEEGLADSRQLAPCHEDHERVGPASEVLEPFANPLGTVRRTQIMRRDERCGAGQPPVCQRDPCQRGNRDPRADARNDLEGDPGAQESKRLLAAPAENERIAPLEADHCQTLACITDQRGLDVSLRPEDRGPSLADGDAPRILAAERQDIQRDKSIVVDDIGLAQALCRPQRQKPGVARTRSHEADDTSERRPGCAPGPAPFRCPRSRRDRAAQDLLEKREPRGCFLLVARLACERGEACQQPPPEAVRSLLIPGGQLEQLQESSEAQE